MPSFPRLTPAQLEAEGLRWLPDALRENPDSGLPTRFHYRIVAMAGPTPSFTETQQMFLHCCQTLGIRAIVQDDLFVFVKASTKV
jgi:hypothetical protein